MRSLLFVGVVSTVEAGVEARRVVFADFYHVRVLAVVVKKRYQTFEGVAQNSERAARPWRIPSNCSNPFQEIPAKQSLD